MNLLDLLILMIIQNVIQELPTMIDLEILVLNHSHITSNPIITLPVVHIDSLHKLVVPMVNMITIVFTTILKYVAILMNNCNNNDCQLYHPSICRNSIMNNFCDTMHCRSYHLVGTYHPNSSTGYRYNDPNYCNNDYNNYQVQNRNGNDHSYVSNANLH